MTNIVINRFESVPEWDNMIIKSKWCEWSIQGHRDGDVEIECCNEEGSNYLFLNQDELKQFIEFLQEKVIK